MIAVYRFYTVYGPLKEPVEITDPITGDIRTARRRVPGKTAEIHKVEYGPLGSDKTRVTAIVEHLRPKLPEGSEPQQGSADEHAAIKWEIINGAYQKWLKGQEITPDGTPLAAWSGVGPEQAEGLRAKNIHTVEQLAHLTDSHFEKYGIQGLRELRDNAKRFLHTLDKSGVENALTEKDIEITGLKDTLASMADAMKQMQHTVANLKMAQQAHDGGGLSEQTENDPDAGRDPNNDDAFGGDAAPAPRSRRSARG